MNDIKKFNHNQFGEVRTIYNEKEDEVWFVGVDIAKNLGYQNGSRDIVLFACGQGVVILCQIRKNTSCENELP